jgi:hypothetical protein
MKRIYSNKIDSNLRAAIVAVGFICVMILRDYIK